MGWSQRRLAELAARGRVRAGGPYACEGCGRLQREPRKLCGFCEDRLRQDSQLLNQMTMEGGDADK